MAVKICPECGSFAVHKVENTSALWKCDEARCSKEWVDIPDGHVVKCTCGAMGHYRTRHHPDCPVAVWEKGRGAKSSLFPEQVRGATHGDYAQMSLVIQTIKAAMHTAPGWNILNAGQKEAMDLTATKIGRIVCGDPNHKDHWADIAGYANLVNDRIPVPHA